MSKRNGTRIAMTASLFALVAILGKANASLELERHRQQAGNGRYRRTSRAQGGFGGEKRAGIKLARKMARNAYAQKRPALA